MRVSSLSRELKITSVVMAFAPFSAEKQVYVNYYLSTLTDH